MIVYGQVGAYRSGLEDEMVCSLVQSNTRGFENRWPSDDECGGRNELIQETSTLLLRFPLGFCWMSNLYIDLHSSN